MKLEVSEQFVKEVHASACDEWKRRIEREFPSLFEVKLEKNKWYKDMRENSKSFFFIEELLNGFVKDLSVKSFGLTMSGEWSESWDRNVNVFKKYYILATKEEVEQMLWKEAEKRGIGKDTKIEKCMYWGEGKEWAHRHYVEYQFEDDRLFSNTGCVYNKGQWATPLNPNKEIQDKISSLQKQLDELKAKVN